MATVTGFTAERMLQIENETVVEGEVDVNGDLILLTREGTAFNAGHVKGADGANATALLGITDSTTLDLQLSGLGTPASPWNLSAEVLALPAGAIVKGLLEPNYRGGPAKVKVGGVLSSSTYSWMAPYQPGGTRDVNLMKVGTGFVILGQNTDGMQPIEMNLPVARLYSDALSNSHFTNQARAFKSSAGIVALSGMIRTIGAQAADAILGYLPAGMAPDTDLLVPCQANSTISVLRIKPDGTIRLYGATTGSWYLNLDGLAYPAAGVASWIPITTWGVNFEASAGWTSQYGTPSYWKDPYGCVWFRGLARLKAAVSTDGTVIFTVPAGYGADQGQHIRAAANGGLGSVQLSTTGLHWKTGTEAASIGHWVSLAGVMGITATGRSGNPWREPGAMNGTWVNHSTTYPNAQYVVREDGLRMLDGLIKSGTIDTRAFVLYEREYWPTTGRIILSSIGNGANARIDVGSVLETIESTLPPGYVSPQTGSTVWFSLSGKCYIT